MMRGLANGLELSKESLPISLVRPVCLIIPPSGFLLDERVFMSLGILRVAAVLEKAGMPVEVLDLSGVANFADVIGAHASRTAASVFGLTATTPQLPAARIIVEVLRRVRPDARVILGGSHATLVRAAVKRERRFGLDGRATKAQNCLEELFDVVVSGDGENAIFLALKPDSPGQIDADDPATPLFLTNRTLEDLPFPARHLVDVDSYHYSIDGERALSIVAQLGCPFGCGFCGGRESPMLRRVRTRTSGSVVAEIEAMYKATGVRGFMFYDDELNVNPKVIELMGEIRALQERLGVEFRLRGFIKAQLFTDAQAEAMHLAGFKWILTGFESGSPRILQNINKRATREENAKCMDIARRHGIKVKGLLSIGHPGESEQTVAETLNWVLEVAPDDIDITIITTYPGTPYYDRAVPDLSRPGVWVYTCEKTGDRLFSHDVDYARVMNYYKGDPDGGYVSFVHTDYLSADQLVSLRNATERAVRGALKIPFHVADPSKRYEHSMGQGGHLTGRLLRRSLTGIVASDANLDSDILVDGSELASRS